MQCEHCLRGDAQNKDIKDYVMSKFLTSNKITYISTVTFTGGEPFLNLESINNFIDLCKNLDIGIGSFYIATNGKTYSNEVLNTMLKLYSYCDDNEISQLHISNDIYHSNEGQEQEIINKLMLFRFTSLKDELDYKHVIAEGRGVEIAELNGTIDNARIIKAEKNFKDFEELNEYTIYLNVDGDVLSECDLSYERQSEEKLFNIFNPKCCTFEMFFKNNEK